MNSNPVLLRDWILANLDRITHFRPRKVCGQWQLIAYNRKQSFPILDDQPLTLDTPENHAVIRETIGSAAIEEPIG